MTNLHKLFALLTFSSMLLPLPAHSQAKPIPFPKGCADCHGSEPKFSVRGARSQYLTSVHRTGGHASYSNSEGCQRCHTNEGFIEFVKKGAVDPKAVVANPSEIGCFTCHRDIQQSPDYGAHSIHQHCGWRTGSVCAGATQWDELSESGGGPGFRAVD